MKPPTGLPSLLDALSMRAFGRTMAEAHERGVCIRCERAMHPRTLADIDFREYCLSGLCPACFAVVMGPEGDGEEETSPPE